MANQDSQQQTVEVPYHKRLAMGQPLTGASLMPGGSGGQSRGDQHHVDHRFHQGRQSTGALKQTDK